MTPDSRTQKNDEAAANVGSESGDVRGRVEDDIERLRSEQGDAEESAAEHERIVEDLQELHDEMRSGHDATTAREAFEQEAAQLDVSEDASEVGDVTDER